MRIKITPQQNRSTASSPFKEKSLPQAPIISREVTDTFKKSVSTVGKGAFVGVGASTAASLAIIGGAALVQRFLGNPVDLADVGSGLLQLAPVFMPLGAVAGSVAVSATTATGFSEHNHLAAAGLGGIAGAAGLGYAVYTALQALSSFHA